MKPASILKAVILFVILAVSYAVWNQDRKTVARLRASEKPHVLLDHEMEGGRVRITDVESAGLDVWVDVGTGWVKWMTITPTNWDRRVLRTRIPYMPSTPSPGSTPRPQTLIDANGTAWTVE